MKKTVFSLSEVASISAGQSAPKDNEFNSSEGLPFIRAGHLENLILYNNIKELPKLGDKSALKNRLRVVKKGSILFAKSGMSAMMNRVYLVTQDSYYVSHLASVTPNELYLESRFCYYFLKHFGTSKLIKDSAYPSIGLPDIKNIQIPLPPLETQKRIADILDAADALRQKDQELLKKYDELTQAIFIDMFGDPMKNEKGWEMISLKDFGKFKNGLNFNKQEKGVSLKYLGVGDFKSKYKIDNTELLSNIELDFMPNEDFLLKNGDLVFVRSNGNKELVGRCLEIFPENDKVTFSGFCIRYRITSKRLTSAYLTQLFRNKEFKYVIFNGGRGANINNINQEILNEIKIPLPSLDLQIKFKNIQFIIENQINFEVFSSNNGNNLFQTLLSKAFKGDLVV